MAIYNSTETPSASGLSAFLSNGLNLHELEKISCSFNVQLPKNPFYLVGKRIRIGEHTQFHYKDYGFIDESIIYEAKVIGVQIGSMDDGIEAALHLRFDCLSEDVVPASKITVLDVIY